MFGIRMMKEEMTYMSSKEIVEELFEDCESIYKKAFAQIFSIDAMVDMDDETIVMMRDCAKLYNRSKEATFELAKRNDKQAKLIEEMSNNIEKLKKQNDYMESLLKEVLKKLNKEK